MPSLDDKAALAAPQFQNLKLMKRDDKDSKGSELDRMVIEAKGDRLIY